MTATSRNLLLAGLLALAALLAALLRASATPVPAGDVDLAHLVPVQFARWQLDAAAVIAPIAADSAPAATGTYAQTLERVYRRDDGAYVMLSVVYGRDQRGDRLQAHRPENCYRAQGFSLVASLDTTLQLPDVTLPLRRLKTQRPGRSEPVSYWLVVGGQAALPGWRRKWAQLRQVLSGEIADGLLVRVSSLDPAADAAFRVHDEFIADLLTSRPPHDRDRLAGTPTPLPRSPT